MSFDLKQLSRSHKGLLIGAGVAGVGLGVLWWRNNKAAQAATDTSTTDTSTTDGTIDPLTGLPYSAEDGTDLGYNTGTGSEISTTANGPTSSTGITDNPSWVAYVTPQLEQVYDPQAVVQALGDYLASADLTSDEATIVRAAWSIGGKPPQGPNTYTLETTTSTPGGGTTTGGGGTGTTPPPTGGGGTITPPPKQGTPVKPVPTPKPVTPSPTSKTKYVTVVEYTTKDPSPLSTLSGIVGYVKANYGVSTTVAALQKRNGLGTSTVIHPGQKIYYA